MAALVQVNCGSRKALSDAPATGNRFCRCASGAGRRSAAASHSRTQQCACSFSFTVTGLPVVIAAGAGSFAESGADPAGKLREAVGRFAGRCTASSHFAPVDQIGPFGDQVVQRDSRSPCRQSSCPALAERYAAVHAAGTLRLLFILRQRDVKFVKILNAFFRRHAPCCVCLGQYSINPVGFPIVCASLIC